MDQKESKGKPQERRSVRGKNLVRTDASFIWAAIPKADLERLAKNLQSRARVDDGLHLPIDACRKHTQKVLESQHGTCLLAGGDSKYCWNEPRDSQEHLKLQWSHKIPVAHNPEKKLENFILLCARCNNQLQSSRTLLQLRSELIHKLETLNKIALLESFNEISAKE
jgi:5-methylcytosine-specific restriction endonuclease McrA